MEDVSTLNPRHRIRRTVRFVVLTQDVLKLQLISKYHFRGFAACGLGDEDRAMQAVPNHQAKPARDHPVAVPTRQQELACASHCATQDAG